MTPLGISPLHLQGWEREKKNWLQESAVVWVLSFYLPLWIPRLVIWKAEFDYISEMQSGVIIHTVGCFQRSSPIKARQPDT